MLAFTLSFKTLQVCPVTVKAWAYESAMTKTVTHPIIPLLHPPIVAHPQRIVTHIPSTLSHNTVNITQQSKDLKQMCVYTSNSTAPKK